jgi:hypothetical protein
MRNLTILLALVFTVMFSSTSFAEWKKVSESVDGDTFYVDFERIRKHGGYVYYWYLSDYLKPTEYGDLSGKVYHQGDCQLFRYKSLSYVHHKQPMGQDTGTDYSPKNPEWNYPSPNSSMETILKSVCAYAK